VSLDPILASASVPPLMRGQNIAEGCYWDGLFAHNPPIRALVGRDISLRPDEIWVIQIDPDQAAREPTSPAAIVDRRFELSSNLSLNAELHWIKQINQWIDEGILDGGRFKPIKIGRIRLSTALAEAQGLASKVDRSPDYLRQLMAEGERSAAAFLTARATRPADLWEVFPGSYLPRRAPRPATRRPPTRRPATRAAGH
jgi:NTE family protein